MRRVEIHAIRFYVDYMQDESYTPTHVIFYAGTGHHDLIQFAEMPLTNPAGWQEVPLADCGGGRNGNALVCWILQVHVKENHQNGKDTHIRGIQIYAAEDAVAGPNVTRQANESFSDSPIASRSRSRRPFHDPIPTVLDELLADDQIPWSSASDFPPGPSLR